MVYIAQRSVSATMLSLLVLIALLLAVPAGSRAGSTTITENDLLAASLQPRDLTSLTDSASTMWPQLPQFNDELAPAKQMLKRERFFVVQGYTQVAKVKGPTAVQNAMTLFSNSGDASDGFDQVVDLRDKGKTLRGPRVGDQTRYFTRPAEGKLKETTVRFRVARTLARVTVIGSAAAKTADLARAAQPLAQRLRRVVDGKLRAAALPENIAKAMPPDAAAPGLVLGATTMPATSWAAVDTSRDPQATYKKLTDGGAAVLGYRRYLLARQGSLVIEITLFPFSGVNAANGWQADFAGETKYESLDPGATGDHSTFKAVVEGNLTNYELQFARGSYVGDVSCFSLYGKTTPDCIAPVRKLGEQWYAILSP